ncbi:hypothetical protein ACQR16_16305 [Bradyrhizobium oligotrophicum]|uniref:hypothetical protein n=1 Tax=Bradyrhizobium oligotrophicum TaxID=44255 RepID=UPI003EBAF1DB
MLGYGRDLIVMIMLVVLVLVMVIMAVIVMTMRLMVVLVLVVLVRSIAGRLGRRSAAGLRDRRLCIFADGLRGFTVPGMAGLVRGDGRMMRVPMVTRFVVRALMSRGRRLVAGGLDGCLGETVRLGVIGRLVMRLIGMIVRGVGVVLMRLVVGIMAFGMGGLAAIGSLDDLALHPLAAAAAARAAMPVAPAVGPVLALFFGFAVRALLGLDQRLPVGDRNLVVVGMDFAEGQEAVAVAAVLDERGLERRLNAGDLRQVNVAPELLALGSFEIKFLDAVAADDNDPGLFRVGSIDQHLVGHIGTLGGDGRGQPRARGALSDDATVHLIRG